MKVYIVYDAWEGTTVPVGAFSSMNKAVTHTEKLVAKLNKECREEELEDYDFVRTSETEWRGGGGAGRIWIGHFIMDEPCSE